MLRVDCETLFKFQFSELVVQEIKQKPDSTCVPQNNKIRTPRVSHNEQNPDSTCVPQDNKIRTHVCPTKTTSRFSTKMHTTQTLTCVVRSRRKFTKGFTKVLCSLTPPFQVSNLLECRQILVHRSEHGTRLATYIGYARIRLHRRYNPHESPSRGQFGACESVSPSIHAVAVDWEPSGFVGRFQRSSTQQRSRRTTSDEGVISRVDNFLDKARKLVSQNSCVNRTSETNVTSHGKGQEERRRTDDHLS